MNTAHHPSDALILDYALGHLAGPFDGVIRAHVGVCDACRDAVAAAEDLGGELLRRLPAAPSTLDPRAICDNHDQLPAQQGFGPVSRADDAARTDDIERFVATYLDSSLDALPWKRLGQGLRLCRLRDVDGVRMWMLRGEPGTILPEHTHGGSELTLVLKGAYFCGSEIFRAGDIEEADESIHHQPVITRDSECICLAATEGPLRFRDWLPRLAQPFVGI